MKFLKIDTIEDIINKVPKDRLDFFLKDLKFYLESRYATQSLINKLPKGSIEVGLKWVDDGKNEFKGIDIKIK